MREHVACAACCCDLGVLDAGCGLSRTTPLGKSLESSPTGGSTARGEVYRYEIRRTQLIEGAPRDVATAVSHHEVVGPAPLQERIRFEGLIVTVNGKERDQSNTIVAVPPYTVSLAPDSPKGA
jgi:hypothetical protein